MADEPRADGRKPRSIRRHIAGLVLLVGAILVGQYLCAQRDRVVPVEIRYRLPDPPPARIAVDYVPAGGTERVAYFARDASPLVVHTTRLPAGMYRAQIELAFASGSRRVERPIEILRDAVITVDLQAVRP
jgi:hypothetical protein